MRYRSSAAQRAFGALFRFARQRVGCARASVPALQLCGASGLVKTLASIRIAPHASFCSVWVGNWSPGIILIYQLLSSAWLVNVGARTTALDARPGATGARRVEDPWACLTTARATSHACVDVS